MPHKEIKHTIGRLKRELEQIPHETSQLEELLEHAGDGIEHYTPEAVQDLLQTLRREVSAFEVQHPKIVALINQVATSLSNLGI